MGRAGVPWFLSGLGRPQIATGLPQLSLSCGRRSAFATDWTTVRNPPDSALDSASTFLHTQWIDHHEKDRLIRLIALALS
jgi:hypothetical protein